jgi:hypothetical protein
MTVRPKNARTAESDSDALSRRPRANQLNEHLDDLRHVDDLGRALCRHSAADKHLDLTVESPQFSTDRVRGTLGREAMTERLRAAFSGASQQFDVHGDDIQHVSQVVCSILHQGHDRLIPHRGKKRAIRDLGLIDPDRWNFGAIPIFD